MARVEPGIEDEVEDEVEQEVMMSESREGGWFALGAFLGASIGAAIGLLYAPRPGAETRRSLTEKSEMLRERALQTGSELAEEAGRVRQGEPSSAASQVAAALPDEAPEGQRGLADPAAPGSATTPDAKGDGSAEAGNVGSAK